MQLMLKLKCITAKKAAQICSHGPAQAPSLSKGLKGQAQPASKRTSFFERTLW